MQMQDWQGGKTVRAQQMDGDTQSSSGTSLRLPHGPVCSGRGSLLTCRVPPLPDPAPDPRQGVAARGRSRKWGDRCHSATGWTPGTTASGHRSLCLLRLSPEEGSYCQEACLLRTEGHVHNTGSSCSPDLLPTVLPFPLPLHAQCERT